MHSKVLRITSIEFSFKRHRFVIHSQQFTVLLVVLVQPLITVHVCVLLYKIDKNCAFIRISKIIRNTIATLKVSLSLRNTHQSEFSFSPRFEKPMENCSCLGVNALSTLNMTSLRGQSISQLNFSLSWSSRTVWSLVSDSPNVHVNGYIYPLFKVVICLKYQKCIVNMKQYRSNGI